MNEKTQHNEHPAKLSVTFVDVEKVGQIAVINGEQINLTQLGNELKSAQEKAREILGKLNGLSVNPVMIATELCNAKIATPRELAIIAIMEGSRAAFNDKSMQMIAMRIAHSEDMVSMSLRKQIISMEKGGIQKELIPILVLMMYGAICATLILQREENPEESNPDEDGLMTEISDLIFSIKK